MFKSSEACAGNGGVEKAISDVTKLYGKGSAMRLGDAPEGFEMGVISTGCPGLDAALGIGGIPLGRIVELYGPEGSGKTTIALGCIASAQKGGHEAVLVDAEHALDPSYASKLGVELDRLVVSQPASAEEALGIAEILMKADGVGIVVVDSVAALVPQAELEGRIGDLTVGLQARIMSQALRRLTAVASKNRCCLLFINQLRDKVGVTFGNPETTPGGRALKFFASIRLEIRRKEHVKKGDEIIGAIIGAKVVKNKLAPPYTKAEIELIYGKGFSLTGDLLRLALDKGIIQRSGSWYFMGERKIGQGREGACETLTADSCLLEDLKAMVAVA